MYLFLPPILLGSIDNLETGSGGPIFYEVPKVLQSLGSNNPYAYGEPAIEPDRGSGLNLKHYIGVLWRRFFYFLLPFGLVSVIGLYLAVIQEPSYLSEGKILLDAQTIAPDIVRPVITATSLERIRLIQQRVTTRDTLLSIANKFGLFPQLGRRSDVLVDVMRKSLQMKPVEVDARQGQGISTLAVTIGFEYGDPQTAFKVANEFISLIVGEDARSRTTQATEAVKILADEAKEIGNKLESTHVQMLEVARRPRDLVTDLTEQPRSELAALGALKAELVQKSAVYSDSHPVVIALKKKVAAMEKTVMHPSQVQSSQVQSSQAQSQFRSTQEEMETLKRQSQALENRLAEVNAKLASARVSENREQQFESLQVIEPPSLPQKSKSNRVKTAGISFLGALVLGIGAAFGIERLDGSIRSRHELAGVVPFSLVVCIPYIETRADITRTRLKILFAIAGIALILAAWGGLAAAFVLKLPLDFHRIA
jgi:uncharacterized protein involved in exopolysaccharide biosynthesis